MGKRKRRVPEVLRQAYGDRVRTLEETLLSLLPSPLPSPEDCTCQGSTCFVCTGVNFLIRSGDSIEYRNLLVQGFCVVSPNAPLPTKLHFSGCLPLKTKCHFFPDSEFLCTSAWHILLTRIGVPMMYFLLEFTSTFLPLSNGNHHQVSGRPLCKIIQSLKYENKSKTKGFNFKDKMKESAFKFNEYGSRDDSGYGGKTKRHMRLFSWQRHKKFRKVYSECRYCLMSGAISGVALDSQIDRPSMLHNSVPLYSAFPKNHILNGLKPNKNDADFLMKRIFGLSEGFLGIYFSSSTDCNGVLMQSNCLYHSLLRSMRILIRNAHHCKVLKLLDRHCLSGCHFNGKKGTKTSHEPQGNNPSWAMTKQFLESQYSPKYFLPSRPLYGTPAAHASREAYGVYCPRSDMSGFYCEHNRVVSFVWSISRSIVPLDLFGDSSGWRALRRNISKFIRLHRFEDFSLKQCMHGLKISSFAFLSQKMQHSRCFCCSKINSKQGNKCRFMEPQACQTNFKKQLLLCWIYWYFSHMIVPMVSASFYVTEKEGGRQDVFYYPKPIWRTLCDQSIAILQEHNYRKLDFALLKSIICRRSFGFSKVRFLPKGKGARPIANLKAPSKVSFPVKKVASQSHPLMLGSLSSASQRKKIGINREIVQFRSVNSDLVDVGAILKGIKVEHPEYLGSSVFNYNDVYRILHPFLSGLRCSSGNMPKVYIVVSDVSKAFDSISQDKLLGIMRDILQEDVYHFRRYAQVICSKRSLGALYGPIYFNEKRKRSEECANSIRLCSLHGVLVNQGRARIKKKELLDLLHEHVKCNVVQVGDAFYLQQVGISQGSCLSSLLCSFYYGHMERTVIFPFLQRNHKQSHCNFNHNNGQNVRLHHANEVMVSKSDYRCRNLGPGQKNGNLPSTSFHKDKGKNYVLNRNDGILNNAVDILRERANESDNSSFGNHVLLRFIDDYLFISTSEKLAVTYYNRLQRGFREYNCYMNGDKLGISFRVANHPNATCNRIYTGVDGISFIPWSGLLVNCQTLEIQADYTRYWTVHLSSTLTVRMQDKTYNNLKAKLCAYMRPKCHPVFYDSGINSPATIRLNVYQAFVLCAMKFHCYISVLANSRPSPKYCADIIQRSLSYMYRLMKKRMYETERYCNIRPLLQLKKAEVIWLGLSAYIRVLKKKQSGHVELLSILRSKLDSTGKIHHFSPDLKYAVDDSHSSLLWKIKY